MVTTCPSCGTARDGSARFCGTCGLDFWKEAARKPEGPATAAWQTANEPPAATTSPVLIAALAAVVVAVLAVGALLASSLLPSETPTTGSARSSATATPAAETIAHAFFRQARSPQAAFSVDGSGIVSFKGFPQPIPRIEVKTVADVYGNDFAGSLAVIADDETIARGDVRRVDNVAYARDPNGDWQEGEIPRSDLQPVNPFARITTVRELTQIGRETDDGAEVIHLQVTKWLGGTDFDDLLVGIAITDQSSTLDIKVDSTGTPLSADLRMSVKISDGVDRAEIRVRSRYRFSDWGLVEPIKAPRSRP